jgi:hypothetical protein
MPLDYLRARWNPGETFRLPIKFGPRIHVSEHSAARSETFSGKEKKGKVYGWVVVGSRRGQNTWAGKIRARVVRAGGRVTKPQPQVESLLRIREGFNRFFKLSSSIPIRRDLGLHEF